MTLTGISFILFGIICALTFGHRNDRLRRWLPVSLFLYHLGFSALYCWYSLEYGGDARNYYATDEADLGVGTQFIRWITVIARDLSAASYLDLFFLFHIFGFFGIWLLYKSINESSVVAINRKARRLIVGLLFLPGLHFWTSAIGKDSITFFGISLVIWSMLALRSRAPIFIIGLILVVMIRPHIAGMLIVSAGLALLWGQKNVSPIWQVLAFATISSVFFAVLPFIVQYVGLETMDVQDLADYIDKRQTYSGGGSGVDISEYPFVLQIFIYLYRPLFVDTAGPLGIVVSLENVVYLALSMLVFTRAFRRVLKNHPNGLFIRFNLIYWLLTTSILALTTANLGIAIRQKNMVVPSMIILLVNAYILWSSPKVQQVYRHRLKKNPSKTAYNRT